MTKKEIATIINVSLKTIYNWEKTKPELIKLINLGLKKKEKKDKEEICKLIEELDKEEKEMYLTEIKARVLRKRINKKGL